MIMTTIMIMIMRIIMTKNYVHNNFNNFHFYYNNANNDDDILF